MLTKVLFMRLEKILLIIIHSDKVGFIKGRSSSDNVRRLLHLMWLSHNNDTLTAASSLDAEKAFDRVEWSFFIQCLRKGWVWEGLSLLG